jgi:hypothetical protein
LLLAFRCYAGQDRATMSAYTIYAYRSQETVDSGCDYDTVADTLAEAKRRARYTVSEEFRQSGEMSTVLGYAQVRNGADEVVFDCFSK